MSRSLLQRWLDHYDPIHRGWTVAGIANGVCAANGFFFPRIRGGYNLRRSSSGVPVESEVIVGAAGADAVSVRTFGWVRHQADTGYVYRLTAISGGGAENFLDEVTVVAAFDGDGQWVGARPNSPADLRVRPLAGGKFELRWTYTDEGQQAEPVEFRIYHNSGSGAVDLNIPVAVVAYAGRRFHFSYESAVFDDGQRVKWMVRAATAEEVEDDNQYAVMGIADASAPPVNPEVVIARVSD